jgi:hypothetical protein
VKSLERGVRKKRRKKYGESIEKDKKGIGNA